MSNEHMRPKLKLYVQDKSTGQWLCEGGTFNGRREAKSFDNICKATDAVRRSGLLDENVDVDWNLIGE